MADVINDLIVKCVSDLGATAVSITHDMASARKIGHRIAMLHDGRLVWQGPVADIDRSGNAVRRPVHPRPRRRADPDAGPEILTMPRAPSLDEARRHFAEELRVVSHIGSERVVEAFAAVPRERFAGPGTVAPPARWRWLLEHARRRAALALSQRAGGARREAAAQYRRARRSGPSISTGSACGKASACSQLGAGSGYYTAILAELTGPNGRIDAVEIDQGLAQKARRNLEAWPAAWVRCADASVPIDGQWDVIVAFAGAAAPAAWWLDALADGGRLLLPMTTEQRGGFMLRLNRHGAKLAARSAGWAGFYPAPARAARRIRQPSLEALYDVAGQQALRSLRRDPHDA